MTIKYRGLDISTAQPNFPFAKVKSLGYKFLILRAGINYKSNGKYYLGKDSRYDYNLKGTLDNKFDWGVYWYSAAITVEEAKKEAQFCVQVLNGMKPTYGVWYDMEDQRIIDNVKSKADRTKIAIAFMEEVKKLGYPCGIYTNPSWLEYYIDKSQIVGKYDIWLAHWTSEAKCAQYGQKMWQDGLNKISGYGDVDSDYCYVDYPTITKKFYDANSKTTSTATKPATTTSTTTTTTKPATSTSTSSSKFKSGDAITLNSTPLYASATIPNAANRLSGTFYIHDNEVIGNRMRITTSKGNAAVTGWVNISDINLKSTTQTTTTVKPTVTTNTSTTATAKFKKGDVVKITGGKYYTGTAIPSWVKAKTWKVYSVSGDRVVINESTDGQNAIMSAVKASDLSAVGTTSTPVSKSEISKGDLVAITGNKYYNGSTIPYWVKCKNWYVLTATPGNDRIVINKSEDGQNAIMSAVARDSLKIVKKA